MRDTVNVSDEENLDNLTLSQDMISATALGEMQDPLSTTNTTMGSTLPTKLWNDLNKVKKPVHIYVHK